MGENDFFKLKYKTFVNLQVVFMKKELFFFLICILVVIYGIINM